MKLKTHEDCLKFLEKLIWNNQPVCPYCNSTNHSQLKNEYRYHCNNCNTSYSVTVGTIFHKTKVNLDKWFMAISSLHNEKQTISYRQLARMLNVNKNTAWYMFKRIEKANVTERELIGEIENIEKK